MSLTAIFTRAPQRFAEVGPSLDTAQAIVYRNPGVSLEIFNIDRHKATFTSVVTAARLSMRRDVWRLSYASLDFAPSAPTLFTSFADASAAIKPTSMLKNTPTIPEFRVTSARALVNPTKKVKQAVSIEV